jgi:nitroreductase
VGQSKFINYKDYKSYTIEEMQKRSTGFLENIQRRRTIREFSDKPVPKEILINCLKSAGTAPSGANCQPWHFSVISDIEIKKKIREAAEKEEKKL